MNNIKFHYYPGRVESKRPWGIITLGQFIDSIRQPKDNIIDIFEKIANAEKTGDLKLKAYLKQNNLFYFTPCIFSNGISRKYADIKYFTGLAVLDFDSIDNAIEFKYYIFDTYDYIIIAFLSPSKRGVKFIVKIPVVNSVAEFKEYYYGLGMEFEIYDGWDGTAHNCVLPLFLSYDSDILHRDNATTFNKKGIKKDAFYFSQKKTLNLVIDNKDQERITNNIKKAFNNIISDGHPQVRAACISLGGYVGNGYITQSNAELLSCNLIECNLYLQKGVKGYQKTAISAIQVGMQSPLVLNDNN